MSLLEVNMGPQHPGTGHFRMKIKLDGDIVVEAYPEAGYVHRGMEKSIEYKTYIQAEPIIERTALVDTSSILLSFIQATEQALKVTVPKRAQYARTIMLEANRISSHLYGFAIFGIFTGHSTMFMWAMGDRELFLDINEWMGGVRLPYTYIVPGGVRWDFPENRIPKIMKICDYFEKRIDEYERAFLNNSLLKERTIGVGVLTKENAIALGANGPNLRGSGIDYDIRKDEPYEAYEEMDFKIPTFPAGDCYSRVRVRAQEMRESLKIIRQACHNLPKGEYRARIPMTAIAGNVPAGEYYGRVEGGRGEVGCHLVSDGTKNPYKVRFSSASFRSLPIIPFLVKGYRLADVPIIYMSLDYWPVDADK
jgi:NADH-quinone oxidoreductase subunit D